MNNILKTDSERIKHSLSWVLGDSIVFAAAKRQSRMC